MAEDEISAEASAQGGKLTAKGDGAARITNSVADLISPFSEIGGAIGEHIRVWRDYSLARTTARARELASQNNIEIRPVHPKALIPWAEGASREDDEILQEKWANLLLNSMGDFDASSVWAANLLSELGPREAQLLDQLDHSDWFLEDVELDNVESAAVLLKSRATHSFFILKSKKNLSDVHLEMNEKAFFEGAAFSESKSWINEYSSNVNSDMTLGVFLREFRVLRTKAYSKGILKLVDGDDLPGSLVSIADQYIANFHLCGEEDYSASEYLESKGLVSSCVSEWFQCIHPNISKTCVEAIHLTPLAYKLLGKMSSVAP